MSAAVYDLHSHSNASDGVLTPGQLVRRAHARGVTALALTDHDTTAGLAEARAVAAELGLRLIPGIELSASFESHCLHVVGLNIDPSHPSLVDGVARQQDLRVERARKIADKLARKGIDGAFQAVARAARGGEITRLHFADFLVGVGRAKTQQDAFDYYLSKGKPAYVATQWAGLAEVVGWINAAGGLAVLAHPLRYKLSNKWINKALVAFKEAGGQGVEVVTGRASGDDIRFSQELAAKHQLRASVGSDFHAPENQYLELGRLAPLPLGAEPIWELF